MAKLTDKIRERILADFNIGKSQNWLANEYELSPATINKICKGLTPKYKDKVNAIVSIKSELSQESEYQSECFDKEVNEKLKNKNLVYGVTQKALQKAHDLLDEIDNANDLKAIVELSDRASITLKVNERHAPRAEVKLTNVDDNSNTNNLTIEQISVAIANGLPN